VMYDAAGKRHLLPHLHDRANPDWRGRRTRCAGSGCGNAAPTGPRSRTSTVTIERERTPADARGQHRLHRVGCRDSCSGVVVFVVVIRQRWYKDENSFTATVLSPAVLIGGLPVAAFVITWVVVALRRRATK